MHTLYKVLENLDSAYIHYRLGRYRDDVVTIHVTVPGQRIEIDVESNGSVYTSFFSGNEDMLEGMEVIHRIIEKDAS